MDQLRLFFVVKKDCKNCRIQLLVVVFCKLKKTRKAQLTQRGTRNSGACLKAHCEQI